MDAEAAAIEEFGKCLTSSVGEEQANFIDAVDVHVGEAGIRYAKEKAIGKSNQAIKSVLSDLTMIVSTYYLVGYYMQSPVYKAAQPDDTYPEVHLFHYGEAGEQGWYISTKWFYTLAQKKQAGSAGLLKAYSPGVHDGLLELLLDMQKMKKVYMPFEHKTEMVDALQNALGSKDAIINDALQEASEDHQQKGKGPKPMNPAGVANVWLERAAILIQLLKDEQFWDAKEKAEFFESSFESMQSALQRVQRNS